MALQPTYFQYWGQACRDSCSFPSAIIKGHPVISRHHYMLSIPAQNERVIRPATSYDRLADISLRHVVERAVETCSVQLRSEICAKPNSSDNRVDCGCMLRSDEDIAAVHLLQDLKTLRNPSFSLACCRRMKTQPTATVTVLLCLTCLSIVNNEKLRSSGNPSRQVRQPLTLRTAACAPSPSDICGLQNARIAAYLVNDIVISDLSDVSGGNTISPTFGRHTRALALTQLTPCEPFAHV